jgi:hypothetical protein
MDRRTPGVIIAALLIAGCRDAGPAITEIGGPTASEMSSATSSCTPTIVYAQTSLAGSTGGTPGLFDQLGLLAGPNSQRRDFYEIFTNGAGHDVRIDRATVYGMVSTVSTAELVPVVIGTANSVPNILIPDTLPGHALATTSVPVGPTTIGPIEISFSPAVSVPAGGQLAFGFIVPLVNTVDATLWGTDVIPSGLSATTPPYFTGFYATDAIGEWGFAGGNHYLVIEADPPTIQDVIVFFDAGVESGALSGSGPGNSAQGRLDALRNMLVASEGLMANADMRGAIEQLEVALLRTDGAPQPPDFVTGTAALDLAGEIRELIACLGP